MLPAMQPPLTKQQQLLLLAEQQLLMLLPHVLWMPKHRRESLASRAGALGVADDDTGVSGVGSLRASRAGISDAVLAMVAKVSAHEERVATRKRAAQQRQQQRRLSGGAASPPQS